MVQGAIRRELKSWLKSNPPPVVARGAPLEERIRVGREWQSILAQGRWVGVHWPERFGGRGGSILDEASVQEELMRAGAPQPLGLFGLTMVGPVLIEHGTSWQQQRFLAKILSGEEIWCQGFSETEAGSDLANIRTKATPHHDTSVGDGFVVSGSKVWTSYAHVADWCFLLARTEPGSTRHKGLSYLLVPMHDGGVSVRPLRQMSGEEEFNEVTFSDVFVPVANVVGAPGSGWQTAITTLMHERAALTLARHRQSEVVLQELLELCCSGALPHRFQDDLVEVVAEFLGVRALALSHLEAYACGAKPGPEGSIDKLLWSESFQRTCSLYLKVAGLKAIVDPNNEPAVAQYLYSRGRTIAAGTSEIQRSIIAERILGLPRLQYTYRRVEPS